MSCLENCLFFIWQNLSPCENLIPFQSKISGAPKFGWVWMSLLTHNWQREVVHADQYYRDFLLNNRQKLDNAFVILMGDHGLRFGEVNLTFF